MSRLYLQVKDTEGALERILGTTRRRGFRIAQCNVQTVRGGSHFDIILDVIGERPIALLSRQFEKLFDVVSVAENAEVALARRA